MYMNSEGIFRRLCTNSADNTWIVQVGGPRKKLSLKDYKAKREAEKARRSIEGESGSEQLSQVNLLDKLLIQN